VVGRYLGLGAAGFAQQAGNGVDVDVAHTRAHIQASALVRL
jgi:hypothetical protein